MCLLNIQNRRGAATASDWVFVIKSLYLNVWTCWSSSSWRPATFKWSPVREATEQQSTLFIRLLNERQKSHQRDKWWNIHPADRNSARLLEVSDSHTEFRLPTWREIKLPAIISVCWSSVRNRAQSSSANRLWLKDETTRFTQLIDTLQNKTNIREQETESLIHNPAMKLKDRNRQKQGLSGENMIFCKIYLLNSFWPQEAESTPEPHEPNMYQNSVCSSLSHNNRK